MFDKEKQSYTLIFAVGICVITAGILSFVSTQLQPLQEANARFDKQKNTMIVLKLGRDGARYNTEEVKAFYADTADQAMTQALLDQFVRPVVIDLPSGDLLEGRTPESIQPDETQLAPAWFLMRDGVVEAVAIDAIGKGLWSTLYGFLALEGDFTTVRGITFYQHGETAGLGDRITESWFQENFVGKKIFDSENKLVPISVNKGKAPENSEHQVDGISGATLTCNGVTHLIAANLERYSTWIEKERKSAAAKNDPEVQSEENDSSSAAEEESPTAEISADEGEEA